MVYINIGTNLGDRRANLDNALKGLARHFRIAAVSDIFESEPWGFSSPHGFLNICAAFDAEGLTPLQVLAITQAVEREISPLSHRNPDGSYRDRLIDIDLVVIDGVEMSAPQLTLPHPHLHDRDFFLTPYCEVRALIEGPR
ncbi:MAG: 2-amino-4-hydroxy-6-hydroxymethyldihydropteridine diphosphokinase [Bacteroidales bacterium]|nr:2-amino-4-hydroxy-6-hydroxymethyldihydropteridine diphosphokinase [Bacteroidales bacterium]